MELLDLPPEIIDRILGFYATKVGVTAAWKNRKVCRAFSTCITHNILAKQPIGAFLKIFPNNGRKILRMNMSMYLKYRIKKLYGAHDFLPNFIADVLDRIEELSGKVDEETRTKNEGILCDLLVKHGDDDVFYFITTNCNTKTCQRKIWIFDEDDDRNIISAATALGDQKALQLLLDDEDEDEEDGLWCGSPAFGSALVTAAYLNQVEIVKIALDTINFRAGASSSRSYECRFNRAMIQALEKNHVEVVQLLASSHTDIFAAVNKSDFERWLVAAIKTRNCEAVASILDLSHHGGVDCLAEGLEEACKVGSPKMIRLFFTPGRLHLNQDTNYANCPLRIAVGSGKVSAVKTLLDLGARPNGPKLQRGGFWSIPVAWAANKGYWEILRTLVRSGAHYRLLFNRKEVDNRWTAEHIDKIKTVLVEVCMEMAAKKREMKMKEAAVAEERKLALRSKTG